MSHELRLLTSGGAPGRSSTIVCMATIQLRPSRMCPTASKAAHALLAILVNRLSKSSSDQNSWLYLIGLRQTTVGRNAERVHHPAGELNDELYVRSTNLRQLAVSAGSYRVLPCAMGLCIGSQPDTRVLIDLAGLVAESHLEALYKIQESPPRRHPSWQKA